MHKIFDGTKSRIVERDEIMEDVIIFGSGKAAESFIKHNQHEFNIVGIIDNNSAKHGTFLGEYLIHSPQSISELKYSKIVIGSMYVKEIKKQLEEQLAVDTANIIIPTKQFLKEEAYPFSDPVTLEFAENCLKEIVDMFNKNDITYYLDYGTLLGIVRDGKLIEWDDDLDFKISNSDVIRVQEIMEQYSESFYTKHGLTIEKNIYEKSDRKINNMCFTIIKDAQSVDIDFFVMYYKEDTVHQGDYIFPRHFFESKEMIQWNGISVSVPNDVAGYLTHVYGDWKVPKQFFTFGDYNLI